MTFFLFCDILGFEDRKEVVMETLFLDVFLAENKLKELRKAVKKAKNEKEKWLVLDLARELGYIYSDILT